jgi:membrane protein EpsK
MRDLMSLQSRSSVFYKNTIANVIFFVLNALLGLFVVPLFIENMGADLYGIWILNFAIMNYFLFLNSSMSGGIIRSISESTNLNDFKKQTDTINVSLVLYFFIGFVIFLVFRFGVDFIIPFFNVEAEQYYLLKQLLLLSASFALIIWPLKVFEAVFWGLLKHTILNIVKGTVSVFSSVSIIILLNNKIGLEFLIIAYYFISLFVGIILFLIYLKINPQYRFSFKSFNKKTIKPILGFSFNLMILEIISMFSFQVDTLVIAYFLPVSFVGVYAIVTKFFYLLQGIYGTLLGAIQPMIFAAVEKGDTEFIRKTALKGFKYILIFYVPLIIVASVLSETFITLWVGDDYGQYGKWSSVFLLQYLVSPAVGVLGTISIGMSLLKYIQTYGVLAAFTNLGLSIFFVKLYGFQGVILGTVITTFFGVMIIYPYYCKAIKLDWKIPIKENYREFISLLFFLLIGFVGIRFIEISNWVSLLGSGFVFSGAIYIWMFVMFTYKEDKKRILEIIKQRIKFNED